LIGLQVEESITVMRRISGTPSRVPTMFERIRLSAT
jgi:hypothetical protein